MILPGRSPEAAAASRLAPTRVSSRPNRERARTVAAITVISTKAQVWLGIPRGRDVPIQSAASVPVRTVLLSVSQAPIPNRTAPTASVTTIGFPPRATAPPCTAPTAAAIMNMTRTATHTGHPQLMKAAKPMAAMAAVWDTDSEKKLPAMVMPVMVTAMIPMRAAERTMLWTLRYVTNSGVVIHPTTARPRTAPTTASGTVARRHDQTAPVSALALVIRLPPGDGLSPG